MAVGEYRITGKLGEGGMGEVYAGVHPVIGKKVAIKVLSAALSHDAGIVQRFIQEARAVNQIGHRNIIDIFAFGQLPSGRQYFVMEFLPGRSLKERLDQQSPLDYAEGFSLLLQVCDALQAAHAEGIVHRDLKPDNIYVAEAKSGERTVKLLDFGIAKLLRTEEGLGQTRTGQPIGTPLYMSPEQCLGRAVDHRTDVYALGVILFEVFTGRLPFPGPSYIEAVNGHISEPPPRPRTLAEIPPALEALILACLAKEAAARPQSIAEVREEILRLAEQIGVDAGARPRLLATPTGARRPITLPAPAGRRRAGWVAALALAGAVGGVALYWKLRPPAAALEPSSGAPASIDLQVVAVPAGSAVSIEGERQALVTPAIFNVARKPSLTVEVSHDGYKPHRETVSLRPDERARSLSITLEPLKVPGGHLQARSNAKKVSWLLDGKLVARDAALLKLDDLAPGPHSLRAEAKGYEPREERIDIQSNQMAQLEWMLTASSRRATTARPTGGTPKKPAGADENATSGWPPR
jgi:serine/threonine-protein kinase